MAEERKYFLMVNTPSHDFPRDTPAGYTVRISWILVFRAYSNGTAAAYMPHGTTEREKEGRVVPHVNYKARGR